MAEIPADLTDLLENANVGHLATVRPDGFPQVEPMWFLFEDGVLKFTHTTKRAKYRNLQGNPGMALVVPDPADPYRFIEARGRLTEAVPDPTGAFYQVLGARYGTPDTPAPPDSADRVILVMSIEKVIRK
ncbi:PPOX class F420-dependent oxidoreductase [Occultella glacieicola]|uniref:PPOX class F420-dependent oxidoreductase n=1 Tax=Occultella glacieicola TaxID=2518684 RepID=A0ABY2E4G6_9MICO|nr:PPOX class F420-dependent oxidoreductase [Occultella glacieicola]TDE94924.1 PPOX class F420-dependent oxidoreductase [Occultella glacieicola]